MNQEPAYRTAIELASTARYSEAREKLRGLLQDRPDHVPALVLLGKVEYYLRRFRSSRRCFETALLYHPQDMSAYFALTFYRERRNRWVLLGAVLSLLVALSLSGTILYRSLGSAVREVATHVEALEERIAENTDMHLESQETLLAELRRLSEQLDENAEAAELGRVQIQDKLGALTGRLQELVVLQERLRRRVLALVQTLEPEGPDPLVEGQAATDR